MALLAVAACLLAAPGCKKQEMQKVKESRAPRPITEVPPPPSGQTQTPRTIFDSEVRKVWRSVEFSVALKNGEGAHNFVVDIGGEAGVPGTQFRIRVLNFVPDFAMGADTITSKSMEDTNPAAKIVILEGGKERFNGWAFRNHPDMHSFEDPNYTIKMTRAVKAGA